jgi:hypothetical protein
MMEGSESVLVATGSGSGCGSQRTEIIGIRIQMGIQICNLESQSTHPALYFDPNFPVVKL